MRIYVHDTAGVKIVDLDDPTAALSGAIEIEGEAQLWPEDGDEPLAPDASFADLGIGKTGHVHRGRGLITVSASYNGITMTQTFGPGTTIERVFKWVVGEDGFRLDPTAAADLVLRAPGSEDDLDPGTHLGTLAGKAETIVLDLLPAHRFAG